MSVSHLLPPWAWIVIVVFAAAAQSVRNAAQRSLVAQAGTLGATLVRFLYGLPFAALWVALLQALPATTAPAAHFGIGYFAWLLAGAIGQIAATAFLLAAMKTRQFVVGVAFSKTEVLQVALFSALFLGEVPGSVVLAAMVIASTGIVLLSLQRGGSVAEGGGSKLTDYRPAMYGLASGAGFAISAVGYRGASLQVPELSPWLAGAWGVMWAQAVQSALMLAWLLWRSPQTVRAVLTGWRVSLLAGLMGAMASIGWFTAFAMQPAAQVRTLGLVEVFFSYLVSRRIFQEQALSPRELLGLGLVMLGLIGICLSI
ncbi:EamA/RhaT family transporter [Variovorax ureilyticus]|uniref:EamA/RhaT family transporter n=1 Tax=Variovorax ureilyticus TaxID=1836198 RepID=A0ABU8VIF0_9BURK